MSAMTRAELEHLCATDLTTDLVTAGRAYGMSRNLAYAGARQGSFPVPVLRVGSKYRVRTAHLAADLLQTDETAEDATSTATTTTPFGPKDGGHDELNPLRVD
ncbi:hypothetical protein NH339_04100 [Aeromicrobium sp. CnD17-E]|nr:hypothetical protein [Aeromicrobium sp. CnD17-E]